MQNLIAAVIVYLIGCVTMILVKKIKNAKIKRKLGIVGGALMTFGIIYFVVCGFFIIFNIH